MVMAPYRGAPYSAAQHLYQWRHWRRRQIGPTSNVWCHGGRRHIIFSRFSTAVEESNIYEQRSMR
jgi:hypothetical protein